MSNKKAIIIGAGIAGLSAGCYMQMNGYDTEIYELHSIAGGLCTAWKKGGYIFDGCVHSIGGLNPRYRLNGYWKELVDLDSMRFHFHEELCQIRETDGRVIHFYTDPDKLEQELLSIAPEDEGFIRDFIKAVKHLSKYDTGLSKPIELWTPLDYYLRQFITAPYIQYLMKWQKSMQVMTRTCKSPRLKRVLSGGFFSHYPAYFLLFGLGELHNRDAGYPIGGSLPLALAIEGKYRSLGGKIHFNAKVTRINVEKDRAVGVTLENGEVHNGADVVISAADGHYTIFEMLGGKYCSKKIEELYNHHPMWPSAVLVFLGLARTFENEASQIALSLETPFVVDDSTQLDTLPIMIYNMDPTMAEKGKTSMRMILETYNYRYWQDLRDHDPRKYEQEKERVARDLIAILDRRLGNIAAHVEAVDISTPATFHRYTNNWKGCIQGWEWLPGLIPEVGKKVLPGLKHFYMIGQWILPGGGVTPALTMGRDITRIICKKDRKKFRTG